MIERFIYDALASGVSSIQDDITILEKFFEEKDLAAEEVAAIRLFFENNPPEIVHNYPREDAFLDERTGKPHKAVWAIILQGEKESEQFLGDEGDDIFEEDEDGEQGQFIESIHSSIYESTYNILTISPHPDVTRYFYELCRMILTQARPFLKSCTRDGGGQLLNTHFSGGDLMPDPRYLPAHLFGRHFTLRAERREDVSVLDDTPRIRFVRGIHVANDVTGVVALVTPYTEEEEA